MPQTRPSPSAGGDHRERWTGFPSGSRVPSPDATGCRFARTPRSFALFTAATPIGRIAACVLPDRLAHDVEHRFEAALDEEEGARRAERVDEGHAVVGECARQILAEDGRVPRAEPIRLVETGPRAGVTARTVGAAGTGPTGSGPYLLKHGTRTRTECRSGPVPPVRPPSPQTPAHPESHAPRPASSCSGPPSRSRRLHLRIRPRSSLRTLSSRSTA